LCLNLRLLLLLLVRLNKLCLNLRLLLLLLVRLNKLLLLHPSLYKPIISDSFLTFPPHLLPDNSGIPPQSISTPAPPSERPPPLPVRTAMAPSPTYINIRCALYIPPLPCSIRPIPHITSVQSR